MSGKQKLQALNSAVLDGDPKKFHEQLKQLKQSLPFKFSENPAQEGCEVCDIAQVEEPSQAKHNGSLAHRKAVLARYEESGVVHLEQYAALKAAVEQADG